MDRVGGTLMIMTLYDFPSPNNGDRYDLSQEELVELLDKVYDGGFQHGKEIATMPVVTIAASYENQDDNTRWKEVWTK